jgi:hypothetical protein
MPTPARNAALRVLAEGDAAVHDLVAGLSDDEISRPRTIGDGAWSVKDLLGHLTQWEQFALDAVDAARAGTTPAYSAAAGGVDELNAEAVARKEIHSLDRIRADAHDVHVRLVGVIEDMPDSEWTSRPSFASTDAPTLGDILGGVLGAPRRPFGHAFVHVPDLESYVGGSGMREPD